MITFVFSLSLSLKCDGNQVFGHRASSKALRKGTTTTSSDKSNSSNHRRFLPAHSRQFGSRPANSPARNQNGKSFGQSVLKRWRNRRPPNSSLSRYLKIAGLQYTTHLQTHTHIHMHATSAHTHTKRKNIYNRKMNGTEQMMMMNSLVLFLTSLLQTLACQMLICCFWLLPDTFGTCYKWIESKSMSST